MRTPTNASNDNLSELEITEVKDRVQRVTLLLTSSASKWLDIAKEFSDAKIKLKQLAFERFINDAGFTKSVADKLICIGKCNRLYMSDALPHIGFIDGWSTLYEVSKLDDKKIDELFASLISSPNIRLSRSVVHNIANDTAATDKMIVFVTIGVQESLLGSLTASQAKLFKEKLDELKTLFGNAPKNVVVKERESAVKLLITATTPVSNSDPALVQTAA